jgi:GAF domain-containing protein
VSQHPQADARVAALLDLVETVIARGQHSFLASVLELEGKTLRHLAAPHLPPRYKEAVDGIEIGPASGSCGTAAFCGHPIYVSDISTDPLWARWPDIVRLALGAGLRACWSMPIMSAGRVLGTFAIYHREPRAPTLAERSLIAEAARSAAVLFGNNQSTKTPETGGRTQSD